ncbi:MAG: SPOR domain-containing protein [Treponema sp.]|jgi:tetratricopeptide (TPR) repeat protein|nr:SPOR domain-containing protein [Treponema sp.]
MGSTRFSYFLSAVFLFFLAFPLNAQNGSGAVSLAAEMDRLEKQQALPAQKSDALFRQARLYQLAGNYEKAAQAWREGANPSPADTRALLEASRLFISLGEYDKAESGIKVLFAAGDESPGVMLLNAQLQAFKTGDTQALALLAADPACAVMRSGIYYTLWKITGIQAWKTRLLVEYPQSPEARIARDAAGIIPAGSPQWLLFPGRESISLATGTASPGAESPAAPAAALQTGLFNREENARAMAGRLEKAGFQARLARRSVNSDEYWAVLVPCGAEAGKTLMELKNAGFESFPVFE